MGRISELKAKEKLTKAEQKELDELLAEAKAAQAEDKKPADADEGEEVTVPDPGDDEDEEVTEEEAKAIDSMADSIAKKSMEKVAGPLSAIVEKLSAYQAPDVKVESPKFIVDKQMGKVSVEDLAAEKVELPNRDGKKFKEVSKRTSHWITGLLLNDKEKIQLLTEGTGAQGGFLVPEDFANVLLEDLRDAVVMRQLADVRTTTSDTVHIPRVDRFPKASWRSEGAVKATSTVQFAENVLTPYSLASIVTLTKELVDDATLGVGGSVVNKVAELMTGSIAETEDRAFWVGNGSGQPTGIDNYTFDVTLSASTTDANRADTVLAAYSRLPQGYRNRASWVMNQRTLGSIRRLKDSNNQYLLLGIGVTPQPTLLGRPVYEQNDIGDGKAFFGDFSQYTIVDREGIQVAQTDVGTVAGYSAFERNLVHVRVEKRVDGELNTTRSIVEVSGLGAI